MKNLSKWLMTGSILVSSFGCQSQSKTSESKQNAQQPNDQQSDQQQPNDQQSDQQQPSDQQPSCMQDNGDAQDTRNQEKSGCAPCTAAKKSALKTTSEMEKASKPTPQTVVEKQRPVVVQPVEKKTALPSVSTSGQTSATTYSSQDHSTPSATAGEKKAVSVQAPLAATTPVLKTDNQSNPAETEK